MEFRLLGSFEASHEGESVLAGSRRQERALLAVLLLEDGRVVTTDRLIDLLWSGNPPGSARGTVHTYVGRLRARLRPYGVVIGTRHDGYALVPGQHAVDVREFLDLTARAAATGDPGERLRCHNRALALWRGPLLADVVDEALRGRLGRRLAELRLSALEQRAEILLAMGRHEQVLADLAAPSLALPALAAPLSAVPSSAVPSSAAPSAGAPATDGPLAADGSAPAGPQSGFPADDLLSRERLVLALMTALYRAGRQVEALALYRRTRRLLMDGAGVEPGAELAALHDRILRADPRLDRPPAPLYAVRVGDQWLPWSAGGHPALEFCNTYAGWGADPTGVPTPGSDWLRGYPTLAVWAGHHDLADGPVVEALLRRAAERPAEAAGVLADARAFRSALHACLTDPQDGAAFGAVAAVVQEAGRSAVLIRGEDGLAHWRLPPSAGLRLPLYAAARAAGELLADPRRFTVRHCPSTGCGWLFLDASGRRRWCSLATCGTRPAS
ncbi:BTAD domain-containing putative transcriptional regulator [Kitasatospora sp. NPDC058063]|uniref:BTAD domain-containing putative transcriptional regulator n=1 Tax=unclassified Kitasatospora TaxID=2633591 RepID=UPI0036DD247A